MSLYQSMAEITDFKRFTFIVGAPRCGTTTIARLLSSHPEVAFSVVKEPHFFSRFDLRDLSDDELRERVTEDYLARFFPVGADGKPTAAEASVSHLYTPEQLEAVLRLWPDSRFIIAVRDPLTQLPSLHQRMIFVGDETLTNFEDAWAAIPERAEGRNIPRSCIDPRFLRYDEAARFGTYVERLFATVGRERCLVVVFDDLTENPEREYRRILDFLDLQPVGPIEVPQARPSRQVRFPWLQRLLKRPPRSLWPYLASPQLMRRMNGVPNDDDTSSPVDRVLSLRKRLLRWNIVHAPVSPVPLHVQQDIRRKLRDEIAHLERLIGRNLGHWLQPRADH